MALLAVPFLLIVIYFFMVGSAATAKPFSDGLVGWLGRVIANIPLAGPLSIKMAVSLASWITNKIGGQWRDLERGALAWISGMYQWATLAITQAMEWPYHLFRLQAWLLTVEIPKLVKAITHPALNITRTITKRLQPIERTIIKLPKLSKAAAKALIGAAVATYVHPYLAELRWLKRHFAALQHAIGIALPVPHFPSLSGILKRLRRLEKRAVVAATVAVVVAALARLGINWARCRNVKRAGKRICGMDFNALESMLEQTLGIFGALSIVALAEELQTITPAVADGVGFFVKEAPQAFHAITDAERAAANVIADSIDSIVSAF